jgi:hypothetical protein
MKRINTGKWPFCSVGAFCSQVRNNAGLLKGKIPDKVISACFLELVHDDEQYKSRVIKQVEKLDLPMIETKEKVLEILRGYEEYKDIVFPDYTDPEEESAVEEIFF